MSVSISKHATGKLREKCEILLAAIDSQSVGTSRREKIEIPKQPKKKPVWSEMPSTSKDPSFLTTEEQNQRMLFQFSVNTPEFVPSATQYSPDIGPMAQFGGRRDLFRNSYDLVEERPIYSGLQCVEFDFTSAATQTDDLLEAEMKNLSVKDGESSGAARRRRLRRSKKNWEKGQQNSGAQQIPPLPQEKRFPICGFCKSNGETWEVYKSHSLKDSENKVQCPILRRFECPLCKATGDNAHTVSYCPQRSEQDRWAQVPRYGRTATGKVTILRY